MVRSARELQSPFPRFCRPRAVDRRPGGHDDARHRRPALGCDRTDRGCCPPAYRGRRLAELTRHAGLSIFDFAACVRGGRRRTDASWAGEPERLALDAHALDRDDLHSSTLVHPGGIVWPAVIVSAQQQHVSGREATFAAALGYELCVATARLLGSDGKRFWHATALAGTVGAAAAAAWVYRRHDHLVSAVGHAFSIAGGSTTCMLERSDTRYVHRAHAAAAGVLAARAACAGLDGTRFGIEAAQGFLAAVRSDAALASATDDGPPALAETGHRFHAACGFAQAAIDAARELGPIPPEQIARVTIEVSTTAAQLAGSDDPSDGAAAWWSIPHAVAVSLASPDADELEAGLSRDIEVTRLASRCSVVAARDDLGAKITVERAAGGHQQAEVEFATGHPRRPLTARQRLHKWELLTAADGEEALALALALADVPLSETTGALFGGAPEER